MKLTTLIILFLFITPLKLSAGCISFQLEHAITQAEKEWGLMGRTSFPEGQGMLFHYPNEQRMLFWSFNCYIDLSVAFLDKDGVIVDIQNLEAHPEWMDANRPIESAADFYRYPPSDPAITRFVNAGITSRVPAKFALEVPAGWFKKMGIEIGDQLVWKENRGMFITQ